MYKDLQCTCKAIADLLIKLFVERRFYCCQHRGLLKLPNLMAITFFFKPEQLKDFVLKKRLKCHFVGPIFIFFKELSKFLAD